MKKATILKESSIRRNNIVISGLLFFPVMFVLIFLFVIAGLDPAIQEISGSRCACPKMTEEK